MQRRCLNGFAKTWRRSGWNSTFATEVRQEFSGDAGVWTALVEQLQESSAFGSSAITNQPLRLLFEVAAVARPSLVILRPTCCIPSSGTDGIQADRLAWLLPSPARCHTKSRLSPVSRFPVR